MDPILGIIDEALALKGLSDSAASKLAVGNFSLIKNMRSSRSDDKRYNFQALQALAGVLGLECYFGPPRQPIGIKHVTIDGADFASIPLHDAKLSAGPGALNDDVAIIDHLAFRLEWLRKIDVKPENAAMARVAGDSMAPAIQSGDLVLIDKSKREVPLRRRTKTSSLPPIFAFVQDGEARVKRIERPEAKLLVLMSDNPNFPPELVTDPQPESIKILGQVVWSGHVWR